MFEDKISFPSFAIFPFKEFVEVEVAVAEGLFEKSPAGQKIGFEPL